MDPFAVPVAVLLPALSLRCRLFESSESRADIDCVAGKSGCPVSNLRPSIQGHAYSVCVGQRYIALRKCQRVSDIQRIVEDSP